MSKPNTPTIIRYELFSNGDTNHVQEEAENEAGPHELVVADKCIRNVCVVSAFYMNHVMLPDQVEEEDKDHRENPSAKNPPKTSS